MADSTNPLPRAEDERSRRPRLGLLLLLLTALIVVVLAIALLGGGDDPEPTGATGSVDTSQAATDPPGSGELMAADASLLPRTPAELAGLVGERVEGTGVTVVGVGGSGFFVGGENGTDEQIYVEYGAKTGEDEPSQDYEPQEGDIIDLSGELRPAPENPADARELEADDAVAVATRGVFVNATTVEPSEN